jgi:nucleoside-diphosphate-sugar epimerase
VTVLVTGATGFVGRHLVAQLLVAGHRVRALVRAARPPDDIDRPGVEVVRGDLSGHGPLDAIVDGCDLVFHLAAAHGPDVRAADCEAVNVRGTIALGNAAARAGVRRFVYASTRGVHGLVRGGTLDERSPIAPDSPYRASKLQAEREVVAIHARHGLPFVILRLPSMIGPGAMSWLGLFRAIARGHFRLVGSGTNRHHLCPVPDAVQALVLAGSVDRADGETFLIGGAADLSLRELVELIARTLDVRLSPVRIPMAVWSTWQAVRAGANRLLGRATPADEFFLTSYRIDDAKARRVLGYRPEVSIDDAVRETAAWYRRSGYL